MKREGMPTQRLEEKRVEEHVGEGERERKSTRMQERERERERAHERTHAGEKERESTRTRERERAGWLLLLYVFPPPGPALCKLGLARRAVRST